MQFNFTEIYATYTNNQLIGILFNAKDYNSAALISARDILLSRNIDEADIHTEIERLKKKLDIIKSEKYEDDNLFSKEETILAETQKANQIIKWISIIYGLSSIYMFLLFCYVFIESTGFYATEWSKVIQYICMTFIPIISVYLFFKRKKMGWMLLTATLTFLLFQKLVSFCLLLQVFYINHVYVLTNIFPFLINIAIGTLNLVFYGVPLLFILKTYVQREYCITKQLLLISLLVPIAIYSAYFSSFHLFSKLRMLGKSV